MKQTNFLLATAVVGLWVQGASAAIISLYQYDNSITDTVRGAAGDASIVSGSSAYTPGVVGQAFDFNGSTYMRAAQAAAGLNSFSISSWVNFDTYTPWATIVKNWGHFQVGAFHLGLDNNTHNISNFLGTTNGNPSVSAGPVNVGQWYHVGVTFGPSLTQSLYIDGALVGTDSASGSIVNSTFSQMSMGAKLADDQISPAIFNTGWLDGKLDELAFFDQELTAADMTNIYNAGLLGNSVTTLGFGTQPYVNPTAAAPEPGQVAASLLLLGGIGGYVFLKRRKTLKTATPAA